MFILLLFNKLQHTLSCIKHLKASQWRHTLAPWFTMLLHTRKCKNIDFEATCQIDQGSRCCCYQKVKHGVKNLIPPLPDKSSSLGDIKRRDVPLYMATFHVSGLLTISRWSRVYAIVWGSVCLPGLSGVQASLDPLTRCSLNHHTFRRLPPTGFDLVNICLNFINTHGGSLFIYFQTRFTVTAIQHWNQAAS